MYSYIFVSIYVYICVYIYIYSSEINMPGDLRWATPMLPVMLISELYIYIFPLTPKPTPGGGYPK